MNLVTVVKLTTAFEKLRAEIAQLRTLVPDPELLERLADSTASHHDMGDAYDLARRIRDWLLTSEQEER